VLYSPRVSTLHNQKAIIKAGSDEFFVTNVSSNTVTGTSTSVSRDVQLTPFFSGVALDVTPQIGEDGTVDTIPVALSQIRESDSIVKARSGQLIVIGGLMRQSVTKQDYKTPVLGDVPGLGRLFSSERDQTDTVELVILLRPIVVNDSDWPTLVSEPTQRAEQLARKNKLDDKDLVPLSESSPRAAPYPPPGSPRNLP